MKAKTKANKARILIVDDEASVLITYKMILEQQGYEVVAAATSKEGIAAIEKQQFDLILCDFSLEQQHSGFEVISAARQRWPEVPSVLLTGYATLETAEEAKQKGIQVLFKPIDIAEFLNTASGLLRSEDESS
ncbi:MAG TPA: response regulator [Terriglobales bacterium]|nr:response regulator [Terriglobales bacterium]